MKMTIDVPDVLFREVKVAVAREGGSLRRFVTGALEARLNKGKKERAPQPSWIHIFGALKTLHADSQQIDQAVADAFEK